LEPVFSSIDDADTVNALLAPPHTSQTTEKEAA